MDRYNPSIVKTCKCGNDFKIYPYRLKTALYCSRKCTSTYRKSPLVGRKFEKGSLAKKGDKNPQFGKKSSPAQKLAASITMNRLWKTPEFVNKAVRTGENNNKWKGGVTKANALARRTRQYKEWRMSVFLRDNFTCQMCSKTKCYVEADHIKRFADYPELRHDVNNGRTLCKPCHLVVTQRQNGCKVLERNKV